MELLLGGIMRAFAKINVGLWIRLKREDGYHTIETVFLPVDLYDDLSVEKSDHFSIRGPHFGKDDLMVKGHRFLEKRFGKLPVTISIEKNIPVGAGLAGERRTALVLCALCAIFTNCR